MKAMCPLLRRDSFSEEEQPYQHSECDQVEFQLTNRWCQAEADTDPNILAQKGPSIKKKKQGRYKNVPYTFGRHFRNWIETEVGPMQCPVVQKFISKRKQNPRYHDSFKDFNDLFQHSGIGRYSKRIQFQIFCDFYQNLQVKYDKYIKCNQVNFSLGRRNGCNISQAMKELMDCKFTLKLKDLTMMLLQKELKSLNKR